MGSIRHQLAYCVSHRQKKDHRLADRANGSNTLDILGDINKSLRTHAYDDCYDLSLHKKLHRMEIKPYLNNAKKHSKKQIEQIAHSIKQFGMNQPIVVDKDGEIIVGHGRYLALQHLGWEVKPGWIIKKDDLTEEQVKAYRLADNKLNESEWDMGLAIEELKELSPEMFDLTGFDSDLLIEPDEKDDQIPENPPTIAKLGDIWQLGRHRVACADSTQPEAVLRLMEGKKADMVFTDPPYGVDYTGKTKDALKIDNDKHTDSFAQAMPNFIENTKVGGGILCMLPAGQQLY